MDVPLHMQGDTVARYTYDREAEAAKRYAVRWYIEEYGKKVHVDEGPWDHYLSECVIVGTGNTEYVKDKYGRVVDVIPGGMLPRGLGAVPLVGAVIIPIEEADLG